MANNCFFVYQFFFALAKMRKWRICYFLGFVSLIGALERFGWCSTQQLENNSLGIFCPLVCVRRTIKKASQRFSSPQMNNLSLFPFRSLDYFPWNADILLDVKRVYVWWWCCVNSFIFGRLRAHNLVVHLFGMSFFLICRLILSTASSVNMMMFTLDIIANNILFECFFALFTAI